MTRLNGYWSVEVDHITLDRFRGAGGTVHFLRNTVNQLRCPTQHQALHS